MNSERDRTQFVIKLFVALIFFTFLIIYNNCYYTIITVYRNYSHNNKNDLKLTRKIILPPKGFLVWNNNCHIPSMDIFAPDYMNDYKPQNPPNCSTKELLVMKLFNGTTNQYTLHINEYLKDQYVKKDDNITCCYEKIIRNSDRNYNRAECKKFEQDFIVPNEIDYLLITCRGIKNTTVIYQDGMIFIQERQSVNEKFQNNTENHRSFGILLFGIDSLSQFNFRRVMPKTFQYVRDNNWFELSGYNKIEDNTFPNLMAVFTGLSLDKADDICRYHEPGGLDNCTTLFKLFNEQGLATAYAEDECWLSTFNYLKPGFIKPPTDYYPRPLLLAIEDKLPIIKQSGLKFCIGPRKYAEYIYDFGVEFADRFLGKSIFGLFWTNSVSHNDWQDPTLMDERMVEYFSEMDFREIFENNAVLLFGDHGYRWGYLRGKKDGYIESRLPMFFLHLPKWFQAKYPEFVWSLQVNKNRLTSPYDLHMTLKHLALISRGKEHDAEKMDVPLSCRTCQTLFKPVFENRTCAQAGIDDHWCTCTPYENIPGHYGEMENMTKLVVVEMNKYLHTNGYDKKCAPMIFKRNSFANLKLELHADSHKSLIQTYRMDFRTNPNDADFSATFTFDTINKNITVDVPEISRLNSYAKDSPCVDDNIVKKFCICNESIKKE